MDVSEHASPSFLQLYRPDDASIRRELAQGLQALPAAVSPKFLYDALGSRLFDAITELREYYPTRTEAAIFAQHGEQIGAAIGGGQVLVDLGAGNCAKAARLFDLLEPAQYVAVDISVDFLRQSLTSLQRERPALPMLGLGIDFSAELALPAADRTGARTVMYAGSSIGNFAPGAALHFLQQVHEACQGGQLLIGVDLVKDKAILESAYDDALGVTAAFNLNLLRHVNGLLGADFDERQWAHVALYNDADSRIEMHLEARDEVTVCWTGGERRFALGERIHTENSYKYLRPDFETLLRDAGFGATRCWTDDQQWFAVFVAQA